MTKMAKEAIKKELIGALVEAYNVIRGPVSQDNFKRLYVIKIT